jgi:hypothetical protein
LICKKCLAERPAARYQTGKQLANDLHWWLTVEKEVPDRSMILDPGSWCILIAVFAGLGAGLIIWDRNPLGSLVIVAGLMAWLGIYAFRSTMGVDEWSQRSFDRELKVLGDLCILIAVFAGLGGGLIIWDLITHPNRNPVGRLSFTGGAWPCVIVAGMTAWLGIYALRLRMRVDERSQRSFDRKLKVLGYLCILIAVFAGRVGGLIIWDSIVDPKRNPGGSLYFTGGAWACVIVIVDGMTALLGIYALRSEMRVDEWSQRSFDRKLIRMLRERWAAGR